MGEVPKYIYLVTCIYIYRSPHNLVQVLQNDREIGILIYSTYLNNDKVNSGGNIELDDCIIIYLGIQEI